MWTGKTKNLKRGIEECLTRTKLRAFVLNDFCRYGSDDDEDSDYPLDDVVIDWGQTAALTFRGMSCRGNFHIFGDHLKEICFSQSETSSACLLSLREVLRTSRHGGCPLENHIRFCGPYFDGLYRSYFDGLLIAEQLLGGLNEDDDASTSTCSLSTLTILHLRLQVQEDAAASFNFRTTRTLTERMHRYWMARTSQVGCCHAKP